MKVIKIVIEKPRMSDFLDMVMNELTNCYKSVKASEIRKEVAKDAERDEPKKEKPTFDEGDMNVAFKTLLDKLGWEYKNAITDAFTVIENGGTVSEEALAVGEEILGADNPVIKTYKEFHNMEKEGKVSRPTDEEFEAAKNALKDAVGAKFGETWETEITAGIESVKNGVAVNKHVVGYAKGVLGADNSVIKYAESLLDK